MLCRSQLISLHLTCKVSKIECEEGATLCGCHSNQFNQWKIFSCRHHHHHRHHHHNHHHNHRRRSRSHRHCHSQRRQTNVMSMPNNNNIKSQQLLSPFNIFFAIQHLLASMLQQYKMLLLLTRSFFFFFFFDKSPHGSNWNNSQFYLIRMMNVT